MSTIARKSRDAGAAGADPWAAGRDVLRAADEQMAVLVDREPELDPDCLLASLPRDLWVP